MKNMNDLVSSMHDDRSIVVYQIEYDEEVIYSASPFLRYPSGDKESDHMDGSEETQDSDYSDSEPDTRYMYRFDDAVEDVPHCLREISKKTKEMIERDDPTEQIICEIFAFKFNKRETFENCLKGVLSGIFETVVGRPTDHLRKWQRLLQVFCQSENTMMTLIEELERMVEGNNLHKHFSVLVSILYENDIVDGDIIMDWYQWTVAEALKEQMKPFVEFLQEE